MKLILANTARKNDPLNSGWREGALKYGSTTDHYSFNHEYGFGMVDAGAAVALAKTWTTLPKMRADDGDLRESGAGDSGYIANRRCRQDGGKRTDRGQLR